MRLYLLWLSIFSLFPVLLFSSYGIQVFVTSDIFKAKEIVKNLIDEGYSAHYTKSKINKKDNVYKISLGKFVTKEEARIYMASKVSGLKNNYSGMFISEWNKSKKQLGLKLQMKHSMKPHTALLLSSGKMIVSADSRKIILWDKLTGQKISFLPRLSRH